MDTLEGDDEEELSAKEKKTARGKVGALLWISLISRPDLSFAVNSLSSKVSSATIETAKEINRVIRQAKSKRNILRFSRLGDLSRLSFFLRLPADRDKSA